MDPATPLLWVLRDHLDLVGAKYGCGIAQRIACAITRGGLPESPVFANRFPALS